MDQDTTGKSGSRSWRDRLGIDEQKPSGSDSTPARAEPAPRPSTPPQAKPAAPKVQAKVVANPAPMAPRPGTAAKAPPAPKPAPAPQRAAQDDAFAERLRKHREAAEEAVKKRSGSASLEKFSFAKKEVDVAKAEKSPPASAPSAAAPAPAPTAPAPTAPPPAAAAPVAPPPAAAPAARPVSTCPPAPAAAAPYLRSRPMAAPAAAPRPAGVQRHNGRDRRPRRLNSRPTGRSSLATLVRSSHRRTARLVRDMHRLQGRTWRHREDTRRVVSPVTGRQPLRRRAHACAACAKLSARAPRRRRPVPGQRLPSGGTAWPGHFASRPQPKPGNDLRAGFDDPFDDTLAGGYGGRTARDYSQAYREFDDDYEDDEPRRGWGGMIMLILALLFIGALAVGRRIVVAEPDQHHWWCNRRLRCQKWRHRISRPRQSLTQRSQPKPGLAAQGGKLIYERLLSDDGANQPEQIVPREEQPVVAGAIRQHRWRQPATTVTATAAELWLAATRGSRAGVPTGCKHNTDQTTKRGPPGLNRRLLPFQAGLFPVLRFQDANHAIL
jgi:hypothetical protein